MNSVVVLTRAMGPIAVGAFGAAVVLGLLHGTIRTTGVFAAKGCSQRRRRTEPSAERVQLLLFTCACSAAYLMRVAHEPNMTALPNVDTPWIAGAAASHGLYVASKVWRRYTDARRQKP